MNICRFWNAEFDSANVFHVRFHRVYWMSIVGLSDRPTMPWGQYSGDSEGAHKSRIPRWDKKKKKKKKRKLRRIKKISLHASIRHTCNDSNLASYCSSDSGPSPIKSLNPPPPKKKKKHIRTCTLAHFFQSCLHEVLLTWSPSFNYNLCSNYT